MNDLKIRRAEVTDTEAVYKIALSAKLPDLPSPNFEKTGFLIFVPTVTEYKKRIKLAKHFLVAIVSKTIVGYLMSYNRIDIEVLGKTEDPVIKKIRSKVPHSAYFIYIDQLAVDEKYRGQGIGQSLLDYLTNKNPRAWLVTAIATQPIINKASSRFFVNKNHWQYLDSVKIGKVSGDIYKYVCQ